MDFFALSFLKYCIKIFILLIFGGGVPLNFVPEANLTPLTSSGRQMLRQMLEEASKMLEEAW